MSFFAQQEDARRHTLRLVLMFVAAVAAVIGAVDLAVTLGAWWLFDVGGLSRDFHVYLAIFMLLAIAAFAAKRLIALRGGGAAIAKMVNAREVKRSTKDPAEKRLINIADEMAIASGLAAPCVYVMPGEKGINAFAAGYSPNQAVIVVTAGALEKLNRDELQGVIGHEFSHILNGDMRLNVRLIGILAGIVIVGEAGLVIIKLGAEAGDTGAIPFILWGALVAAVGYIGVFFGRMIKAAVSRQRELLADASSVQFTRNPDGLLGALEKIRRDGAVVANPLAGEMSHMYFGQAIAPKIFSDLFATHPRIEERIASLTGRKPDAPSPGGKAAPQGIVENLLAMVGRATPEHVDHAAQLVAGIPPAVRRLLDTPEGSRRVIYAYLFSTESAVRLIQIRALADAGDGAMATGIDDLIKALREIGAASRLPVISLAVPALREMDGPARKAFLRAVDALIKADNEVTLAEFVIRTILGQQLSPPTGRGERVKFASVKQAEADMVLLLATLARAGATDRDAQASAFERGVLSAGLTGALPADGKLDAPAVAAALGRLRQVAPLAKPAVMAACVETALADQKLLLPEMELLRAIGMAIDCPLPPALESLQV